MSHQPLARAALTLPGFQKSRQPVTAISYRSALQCLYRAYNSRQSLAVLIGEGKLGATYLLDHFLAGIDKDASVVRISEPCSDELSAMSAVIRGIGFDPTDLNLADMENVLALFLSFQANHNYRTVLCIEDAEDRGLWVLGLVHRLLDEEAVTNRGLLVLLSGLPRTDALLNESLLDAVVTGPDVRIVLAPFTLAETREYLRWWVESAGTAEIADVFEFDAISLIHELTNGATDDVGILVTRCLTLAADGIAGPVNVEVVNRARLRLESVTETEPLIDQVESSIEKGFGPHAGRLVVRIGKDHVQEFSLDRGHILIGRGKLCDVRIASPSVSRHHALIVSSPAGTFLVDLESTNGTYVDGCQIKEHALQHSGVISMGDCGIDFTGGEDQQGWILDVHGADRAEPCDPEFVTQHLKTWQHEGKRGEPHFPAGAAIKGNINSKGEKIYHVPGTSKYDATRIDESKGERWFATEDEATEAGWRAPRIS